MHAGWSSDRASMGLGGGEGRGLSGRRAFTLVEIMVVIVILGILVAVAMTLASRVTQGGRRSLTEDTIRLLDTAVEMYVSAKEQNVPAYWLTDNGLYFPMVDGRWYGRPQTTPPHDLALDYSQPTTAFFIGMAREVPAADEAIKRIDPKLLERRQLPNQLKAWGWVVGTGGGTGGGGGNCGLRSIDAVVVNDAWGRPIRMVHPSFDGGHAEYFNTATQTMVPRTVRREMTVQPPRGANLPLMNATSFSRSYKPFDASTSLDGTPVGDADEGICPGGRPYFYSAGPDGDPGTRSDNVYTTRPNYPAEKDKSQAE